MNFNSYVVKAVKRSLALLLPLPRSLKGSCSKGFGFAKKTKNWGFTLAEVLITLAIIGVVATLTLPTLMTKYEKQVTVTRLKKTYLQLQQAVTLSEKENGPKEEWNFDLPPDDFLDIYLKPFIQINKKSVQEINNITNYKFLNGKDASYGNNRTARAITLADGTIIMADSWVPGTNTYRGIRVDINGTKKPNIAGKDLFAFVFYKDLPDKIVASMLYSTPPTKRQTRETILNGTQFGSCNKKTETIAAGLGCTAVIVLDGWQIKDDYPW